MKNIAITVGKHYCAETANENDLSGLLRLVPKPVPSMVHASDRAATDSIVIALLEDIARDKASDLMRDAMHRAGALAWEDLCWNVCGDAELNVADPCEPSFLAPNPISIRRPPLVRKAMRIDRQTRGTIVVADDDEVTRLLLERILTRAGFTVEAFENGQLACDAIQREAPDVVLLDWMMPVMDGPATVKYLKAQPDTRGIPVVMLTIHAEIEDRVAAFETGVQDFLMKPFDARELVARIEQQMRWRGVLASDAPAGPRLECVRPIETDYTMTP